tara:strand:- start:59 stop:451 length:393 start_codon:yes stop_codon:yes gene_type:complete
MALPPTSNAGSEYFNINQCRTFGMTLAATTLTVLSGIDVSLNKGSDSQGQACSEVIIKNNTGGAVTIYDKNNGPFAAGSPKGAGGSHGWVLGNGDEFTFRGLTNVNEVSAYAAQEGHLQYRTQFFSYNPR